MTKRHATTEYPAKKWICSVIRIPAYQSDSIAFSGSLCPPAASYPYQTSRMSFLSGLFGDRTPQPPHSPSDHPTSADVFSSTTFRSTTSPSPPSSTSTSSSSILPAPTALDTFSGAFDPAKLHPLAGLGDKLDFLQLEEDKLTDVQGAASVLPSRGWTDDLCVGTGTTYLSGGFKVTSLRIANEN